MTDVMWSVVLVRLIAGLGRGIPFHYSCKWNGNIYFLKKKNPKLHLSDQRPLVVWNIIR